jgi:hypothetical protein
LDLVREAQETIQRQVDEIVAVWATLDPATGACEERRARFEALRDRFGADSDSVHQHMVALMTSFAPGLFVGGDDDPRLPHDNLDLERWFRCPKGHERRIHGHRHAGVRIVQEGPTMLLALDAHVTHPGPFDAADLMAYRSAREPECQRQALSRRKVMRKARSKTERPKLLAGLERRYLVASKQVRRINVTRASRFPGKQDTVARKSGLLPHAARAWCRLWVVSARPSP